MDIDLVLKLEEKIDQLLARKVQLEEECRRLQADRQTFLEERQRFSAELDRILSKLDGLES